MKKNYFLLVVILFPFVNSFSQTNINVVFHVVYNTTAQNIPDSCLQQQLDVLNEDFNAANADIWKVPTAWQPIIGNMNVHFQLATIDPLGNSTTGIERRQYPTISWTTNDNVKHFAIGGLDAWPDTSYLNIWICNLASGLLCYAQLPGGPAATDGVVIHYQVTGRGTYTISPYNLGRAGTHGVGHYYGLMNYAGDPNCSIDQDNIPDTPNYSSTSIYGGFNPFQVVTDACNPTAPGVMWMNFMTFVDDSSMYFFTQDQVDTMTWVMLNMRLGSSSGNSIATYSETHLMDIFPSPSPNGIFTVKHLNSEKVVVHIYNLLNSEVATRTFSEGETNSILDLSCMASGIYSVVLMNGEKVETKKICIAR